MEKVVIGNAELYCGDNREVLPLEADMVFTSPPYNMNLRIRNGAYCSRQIVEEFSTKYENYHDNLSLDEYEKMNDEVLTQCLKTVPLVFYNVQFLTGNKRPLFRLIGKYADQLKEVIIWDKTVAQPAMADRVLNSRWESILVFDRDNSISRQFPVEFKRGTIDNIWQIPRSASVDSGHGATFPVALPSKAIASFTENQSTILDPFMGTGTTGVACMNLDRKFIGIEIDPKYFDIACKRIESAQQQLKLAL